MNIGNFNIRSGIGATAIAALAMTVCAPFASAVERPADQVTPGTLIDDATLSTRVKHALVKSPDTKAHDIEVEVHNGEVQLSGFVRSDDQKSSASSVAAKVGGVKVVHNNLQVQPVRRTTGEVIDDAVITARVKTALIGDARTKAYQIEVTTNKGDVQLGGFVESQAAKAAATEVAVAVAGVRSVNNGLEVKG